MPHWIEFLLSGICHQYDGHAIVIQGAPLPLCARCAGLFGGALLSVLVLVAFGRGRRIRFAPWWAQGALAALATWWGLDGVNSLLYALLGRPWLYEPTNALRLMTGLGLGVALGLQVLPVAALCLARRPESRPVIERPRELGLLLLCQAAWAALLLRGAVPYPVAAAIPILGVATMLGGANGLLLVALTDYTPDRLSGRRIVLSAAGGLLIALALTSGLAGIRSVVGI